MEEFGYWANKIGRKIERQEKCDFNNIKYSKIADGEVILELKKESTYC